MGGRRRRRKKKVKGYKVEGGEERNNPSFYRYQAKITLPVLSPSPAFPQGWPREGEGEVKDTSGFFRVFFSFVFYVIVMC